jgi:Zn-dependent protease/predicted transcriptional regulator
MGLGFILTLFVIVVMHEYGHALTARRFGIRTRDITLLPIGGVARLERMPDDPKQELLVALAGPAVNVVLGLLLFSGLYLTGTLSSAQDFSEGRANFGSYLMAINFILAVFNMLPAFPMDGGRVLRALLAIRMNYARATRVAANIGQAMAVVFGIAGLFAPNIFLVLIAVFVWMGAAQEADMVQMKYALGRVPVSQVMVTHFRTLAPDDRLSRAVESLLAGAQQDFPVMDDGRLVGLLTRGGLVNGLAQHGRDTLVRSAMESEFATADPGELAEKAFIRLQHGNWRSMPVMRNGELLGMLTGENVGEFLMIQAALQGEQDMARMGYRVAERQTT